MALASIFGTNLFQYDPDGVIQFYESYPAVQESFRFASEVTGVPVEPLLKQNGEYQSDAERIRVVSVALAAAQLGIQDALVERGLRPEMAGGLSLGGLVASSVAGAVGRRELFELLSRGEHRPHAEERPEGIAAAYLLPGYDEEHYHGESREGVYLGADFGYDANGRIRIVLLSGYRDALEKLAAGEPDGVVNVTENADHAVHSPLREEAAEAGRPYIEKVPFSAPRMTLCSCLEQKTVTTADEVREMFVSNVSRPVSVPHLTSEMQHHKAQLGLVIGPSPVMNALQYPFPVVFVDSPAAVPQAVAAVFEHGVRLRRA